jgi:hypothetical protein
MEDISFLLQWRFFLCWDRFWCCFPRETNKGANLKHLLNQLHYSRAMMVVFSKCFQLNFLV